MESTLSEWKEKVLQHCRSGIEVTKRLLKEDQTNDNLRQILHEFFEIGDHLN